MSIGRLGAAQPWRHRDGAGALHQGRPGRRRRVRHRRRPVKITATTTAKVPNTAPTAASSGTDLNGQAARVAARAIKRPARRSSPRRVRQCRPDEVVVPRRPGVSATSAAGFGELARKAVDVARRVCPSTGFYKTPKIFWDRTNKTRPAVLLFRLWRRLLGGDDRHHDGRDAGSTASTSSMMSASSLNPAIDIGQIEGGFVQGMGWLTTEELVFDAAGRLTTHAPSTYKIPDRRRRPGGFPRRPLRERATARIRSTAPRRSASRR